MIVTTANHMDSVIHQEDQRMAFLRGPVLGIPVSVVLSRLTISEEMTLVYFVKGFIQVFIKMNF